MSYPTVNNKIEELIRRHLIKPAGKSENDKRIKLYEIRYERINAFLNANPLYKDEKFIVINSLCQIEELFYTKKELEFAITNVINKEYTPNQLQNLISKLRNGEFLDEKFAKEVSVIRTVDGDKKRVDLSYLDGRLKIYIPDYATMELYLLDNGVSPEQIESVRKRNEKRKKDGKFNFDDRWLNDLRWITD